MRKRRAIVFDDDPIITGFLKNFLSSLGYDVLLFTEPVVCPLYGPGPRSCSRNNPCADLLITDYVMPGMSGLDLLREQVKSGCNLPPQNKALISGYVEREYVLAARELGCAFFEKPLDLDALEGWIGECERRLDLSQPLAERRKEIRHPASAAAVYRVLCANDLFSCSAIDVSLHGYCLKLPQLLKREQLVFIAPDTDDMPRAALVQWTRKQDDGFYHTGLRCC